MMHLTIFSTVSSFSSSSSSEKRKRGTEGWAPGAQLARPSPGAATSAERSGKPCVPHHARKPLGNVRSLALEKKQLKQQPCVRGEGDRVAPPELGGIP